jgi:hypothetical protein
MEMSECKDLVHLPSALRQHPSLLGFFYTYRSTAFYLPLSLSLSLSPNASFSVVYLSTCDNCTRRTGSGPWQRNSLGDFVRRKHCDMGLPENLHYAVCVGQHLQKRRRRSASLSRTTTCVLKVVRTTVEHLLIHKLCYLQQNGCVSFNIWKYSLRYDPVPRSNSPSFGFHIGKQFRYRNAQQHYSVDTSGSAIRVTGHQLPRRVVFHRLVLDPGS